MPLADGTRLGPYEVLASIGAGGMGEVYRARDPRLNREVAIKVLPERLASDPQALARFEIDQDPSFVEAHLYLGWVYEQMGMLAEAIAELRQALSGSGGGPRFVSALGHAYAISGQRRMAEESLARLREQSKQRYVAPTDMAAIYIGLEEKDQALKYLEMASEDRSWWMMWLGVDPRFDAIRGDPRYQDLLRRMGLTP